MRYIRRDLQDLVPYRANNIKYDIALNNNESPFDLPDETKTRLIKYIKSGNIFNRYPDPDSTLLRQTLAKHYEIDIDNILVASGSDELIQMTINAFVDKGEYVLCPTPSFSMYGIYTQIRGGIPIQVDLDESYQYDMDVFLKKADRYDAKLAFVCNPNNPTGTTIARSDIKYLIENFKGIVVIDEAYVEFYGETIMDFILECDNAIVLRTFSKAFGLAGLRVGYLIANQSLVEDIYTIKSPYNINTFSQMTAVELLKDWSRVEERIAYIVSERERLYTKLCGIDSIDVFPSSANFLLIKLPDSQFVYNRLLMKGILVRNFLKDDILSSHIRVSIGTREENNIFLQEFLSILEERSC